MNKKIIVANWKMNPKSVGEAEKLFKSIKKSSTKGVDTVVCAPFPYLSALKKVGTISSCALGAQNVHFEKEGAFTGEVSVSMLNSFGAKYCIVGHSERRAMGEEDGEIAKKILALTKAKIAPILCVGERERDHSGFYLNTVKEQVNIGLSLIPKTLYKNIVIAYEPVWAIGSGATRPATPAECHEMIIFIRKCVSDISTSAIAHQMRVIYGGSANEKEAHDFFTVGMADGLLVGRASLNAKNFGEIIKIAGGDKAK
jgi:triosephosphate isomerase